MTTFYYTDVGETYPRYDGFEKSGEGTYDVADAEFYAPGTPQDLEFRAYCEAMRYAAYLDEQEQARLATIDAEIVEEDSNGNGGFDWFGTGNGTRSYDAPDGIRVESARVDPDTEWLRYSAAATTQRYTTDGRVITDWWAHETHDVTDVARAVCDDMAARDGQTPARHQTERQGFAASLLGGSILRVFGFGAASGGAHRLRRA